MRVKAHHLNLGILHEAYIVCSSRDELYFKEVANILEREYSVKSGMFVYDKDVLTPGVMRQIRNSYNVLFMLNEGVSEAAAMDPEHPYRKVYGYVNSKNPHSISLVSINGCPVRYDIDFPPEMESYKWLHRKSYYVDRLRPDEIAKDFYEEFRRNHMRGEKNRLRKLCLEGRNGYSRIYDCLFGGLWRLLIVELVAALLYYFYNLSLTTVFENEELESTLYQLESAMIICSLLLVATCIIWGSILIARYFRQTERLLDVSSVFADFKKTTFARLAVLSVPALSVGIAYLGYSCINLITTHGYETNAAVIAVGGFMIAVTVTRFVKAMVMRTLLASTRYYLEVSALKIKTDAVCLLVDIFIVAVVLLSGVRYGIF